MNGKEFRRWVERFIDLLTTVCKLVLLEYGLTKKDLESP